MWPSTAAAQQLHCVCSGTIRSTCDKHKHRAAGSQLPDCSTSSCCMLHARHRLVQSSQITALQHPCTSLCCAYADDCDDLLSALVTRARHYKTEAEKLHEKERAAAGATGPHSAILPHPNINWSAAPWRYGTQDNTHARVSYSSRPPAVRAHSCRVQRMRGMCRGFA